MFKGSSVNPFRSLLTETLPYEVPVIFSNEVLFASLSAPSADPDVKGILSKMRGFGNKFTVPYAYHIAKDESRTTALSIIHPNHQLRIAEFYELYSQSMLDYCNRSEISLRRPVAETPIFTGNAIKDGKTLKLGIPHVDPADGDVELGHVSSFFLYGKYNLMGKFLESAEFRRHEKRFKFMRTIDVTKCFFNIYTHSITWSVKGKDFAKTHGDLYSFEARFDKLMQTANYNETNGIVVGPEISRIFAEIVFQDIDRRVLLRLQPRVHERDFVLRRYVDDYFIFANREDDLDLIMGYLRDELENYKLFINAEKTSTSRRPFVSKISLARNELGSVINCMHICLDDAQQTTDPSAMRSKARELKRHAFGIRLICERHGVSFSTLSGWLLSTLRRLLRRAIVATSKANEEEKIQALTDMSAALLEIIFYLCALDTRVRSTYSLCQIVAAVHDIGSSLPPDVFDRLTHIIAEEFSSLIRTQLSIRQSEASDPVELYNLLIAASLYLGNDFLRSAVCVEALHDVSNVPNVSYFGYITAKFCFLKAPTFFATQLAALNAKVRLQIESNKTRVGSNAEFYLLACDYVSAPDISPNDKRAMLKTLCGGQPSNAAAEEAGKHLAFADWNGVRIEHILARKELRPVYAWI